MLECLTSCAFCSVLKKDLKALKFWSVLAVVLRLKVLPYCELEVCVSCTCLGQATKWEHVTAFSACCFLRAMCFSTIFLQDIWKAFFFLPTLTSNLWAPMLNFSHFCLFFLIKKKWGKRIRVSSETQMWNMACGNLKTVFPQSRDKFWTGQSNN